MLRVNWKSKTTLRSSVEIKKCSETANIQLEPQGHKWKSPVIYAYTSTVQIQVQYACIVVPVCGLFSYKWYLWLTLVITYFSYIAYPFRWSLKVVGNGKNCIDGVILYKKNYSVIIWKPDRKQWGLHHKFTHPTLKTWKTPMITG